VRISDLMQAMADAGAPMEAILIAVRALEECDAELAALAEHHANEKIRTPGALRQERYRERHKASQSVTGDVTRDVTRDVTSVTPPSLSPSPLLSPHTPQITPRPHTHPDITPRARERGSRLAPDWQPEPLTGDIAKRIALWPPGTDDEPGPLSRELAKFRDWAASATGQNALKTDWQAAWRNWLRRADDEGRQHRNERPANYRNAPDKRDGAAKALDRRLGFDDAAPPFGRADAFEGVGDSQRAFDRPAALR